MIRSLRYFNDLSSSYLVLSILLLSLTSVSAGPLKVFILAGQSNMQGHGEIEGTTPGHLSQMVADDPVTYGHLKDGNEWRVRDDVGMWYVHDGVRPRMGGLTVGNGAKDTYIGPELQFGHVMGDSFVDPVLLLKTAWGGKSLGIDFRPPSLGDVNPTILEEDKDFFPYVTPEEQGYYYREMMSIINDFKANPAAYYPDYDPEEGYEIMGFAWHQGFNDRIKQSLNDHYESNLVQFIKDIRTDLGIPNLPFALANTGMSGWSESHHRALSLMEAQLAVGDYIKYPAHQGNVTVHETRDYYRDASVSPASGGNLAFHWNLNSYTYYMIGKGLAEDMLTMISPVPIVKVPDLTGETEAAARSAITNAGLVVGNVTPGFSDTVPLGKVITQSNTPGSEAEHGWSVDFVVSQGNDTEPPTPNPMTWLAKPAANDMGSSGPETYMQISSDADSGISLSKTYTHAIDFGTEAATVNGVEFAGDLGQSAGGRSNAGSRTFGNAVLGGWGEPAVTGDVATVFKDMTYSGSSNEYVELDGLIPGQWYALKVFHRAWDFQGTIRSVRMQYDVGSDGSIEYTSPNVDQNDATKSPVNLSGNVSFVSQYVYQADLSGKIRMTLQMGADQTGGFHLYGLTNEVYDLPDESPDQITMSATIATDGAGVQYYFEETTGNPGGDDSGWQDSSVYTDTGLNTGVTYAYRVKARDKSNNQNETGFSSTASAVTGGALDTDPPTPNPASFFSLASANNTSSISMTATTGSDLNGPIEYYFEEKTGNPGGSDSGWQTQNTYTDTGLTADTEYRYTVKMRDSRGNMGSASLVSSATTFASEDTDPPSPNPASFSSSPAALNDTEIRMMAETGSDPSGGVEYYFTETSGNPGGNDSGWQPSPVYTDSGLSEKTQYTYTVKMRDSLGNVGYASPGASATTDATPNPADATPLKVFILAGQSNMQGHGEIQGTTPGHLDQMIIDDPATYGFLKNGDDYVVRDDVQIWFSNNGNPRLGGLSAGYGVEEGTRIGPELMFGYTIGEHFDEPVLIIKAAWGARSLAIDFRPPSSGDVTDTIPEHNPVPAEVQGYYYRKLMGFIDDFRSNPAAYYAGYDPSDGFEFVGFGWHQGYSDRVDQRYNDEYEANLVNLINDVRADLGVPKLPFSIATTGMSGWSEVHPRALSLMAAQLAMTDGSYPLFNGNVIVQDTRDFWRDASESPRGIGYHWNNSAMSYYLIGQSMGNNMISILPDKESTTVPNLLNYRESNALSEIVTRGFVIGTVSTEYSETVSKGNVIRQSREPHSQAYKGWSLDIVVSLGVDNNPPEPNPLTWVQVPMSEGLGDQVSMTVATATDKSGVEYYFEEISGNIGGSNSGWQDSASYTDTGLSKGLTYIYRVKARDKSNALNETSFSSTQSITTETSVDETAPNPNPLTWSVDPKAETADAFLNASVFAGTNPATNQPWQSGDTYRLMFVTSTQRNAQSTNISDYNSFVQAAASASSLTFGDKTLASLNWKAIGSTASIDARDNTGTHPSSGAGSPIYLVDGSTLIATSNTDLWDGALLAPIDVDQNGNGGLSVSVGTGTNTDGTKRSSRHLGGDGASPSKIEFGNSSKNDSKWALIFNANASDNFNYYAISEPITYGASASSITMTATTATDDSGVEYYFKETSGNAGGSDSGWQDSPVYTDAGLTEGLTYAYQVKARDKSANQNETIFSTEKSLTLGIAEPDTDAPSPNPASFLTAPTAQDETSITMTAVTGSDASGVVEYYFEETSGNAGGSDSGWQSSAIYTDSGLTADTQYTYTVTMRDTFGNTGNASAGASATTDAAPVPTVFTGVTSDDWNVSSNWDSGLPSGSVDVSLAAGKTARNDSVTPATASGKLIINEGSTLLIANNDASVGEGDVVMDPSAIEFMGGTIDIQSKDSVALSSLLMTGSGTLTATENTGDSRTRYADNAISGSGLLTIVGRNKQLWNIGGNNAAFTGKLVIAAVDRYEVKLNALGSAGSGNVIITPRGADGRSAVLVVAATGALANVNELTLNGSGWDNSGGGNHQNTNYRLVMDVNDSVGSLIVDDTAQTPGTYGRLGHGGVSNEVAWISGDGILTVNNVVVVPQGYNGWKSNYSALSNDDMSLDFDSGGLSTGVEWVLDGDPTDSTDDVSIKPTLTMNGGNYVFTYRRNDLAHDDPNTTITVEYSEDMESWMTASNGGSISIVENNDAAGAGVDTVSVTFNPNIVSGKKIVVRLKVVVAD